METKHLSENTIKTYESTLRGVANDIFDGKTITKRILNNENNVQKLFDYMDGKLKIDRQESSTKRREYKKGTAIPLASQKIILQAISAETDNWYELKPEIHRLLEDRFKSVMKQYKKDQDYEKEHPKEKDVEKIIDLDSLKELKEKLKANIDSSYQPLKDVQYIIISLYTDLTAPCRPQDFYNTYITTSKNLTDADDTRNYLLLDKGIIVINKGKTPNSVRDIPIPNDLLEDIKSFYKKSRSKWLIPSTQDKSEHMEQSAFTKLLQRLFKQHFGKPLSASMLRKIHVSRVYKKIDDEVPEFKNILLKLKEKAKAMGHTVTTQELYARLKQFV